MVHISDDRDGFLAGLDAALAMPLDEGAAARMAAVADQTWDRRVEDGIGRVTSALHAKTDTLHANIEGNPAT